MKLYFCGVKDESGVPEKFARLKEYFNEEDLTNPIKVSFITNSQSIEIETAWRNGNIKKRKTTGEGEIPNSLYVPCGIQMGISQDNAGFNSTQSQIKNGILPIQNINSWVFHNERHSAGGALRGGESNKFKELKKIMLDKFLVEITLPDMDDNNSFYFKYLENESEKNMYLLGAGAQNIIYFVAAVVYLDEYDLMLIDEPELHLHPEIQKKLGNIFRSLSREFNIQFIIATQSPFIISNLTQEDNVFIMKEKDDKIIAEKQNSFVNVAVAMELGCEPKDVGAPENFILLEEASMETLLRKVNKRFFKRNIQFIACSGVNDLPTKDEAIRNIISHNQILKCTPIYISKYFIVTDKLTNKIKEDSKIVKIQGKLGERFIELDCESLEDSYPDCYLNKFDKLENPDRNKVDDWINNSSNSKEKGKRKNKLAEFIGGNIKEEDFRSSFPKLVAIFEEPQNSESKQEN